MMSETTAAGAALDIKPRIEELERLARLRRPPEVVPVGQCPYCHHDLERRDVYQRSDVFTMRPGQQLPGPLLVFWGCTNEECRLMFWQHPRATVPRNFPLTDDQIEH
jgi:hypothetical protein